MTSRRIVTAAAAAVLTAVSAASGAQPGPIGIEGAWIRTPPPGAPTAAAYAVIENRSGQADRLLSARTDAAASATPHVSSMAGGVMQMREAAGGLPIAAHGSLALSPGGDHVMLMGLKRPLHRGDHVAISLSFARAGRVSASFEVRDDAPVGRGLGHFPM